MRQESYIERLSKQKTLATIEEQPPSFRPSINNSGKRFQSRQDFFESLHELARAKQQFEADLKYIKETQKLHKQAVIARNKLTQDPKSESIHTRLFNQ